MPRTIEQPIFHPPVKSKKPAVYRCVCEAEFTDTNQYNKHIAHCVEVDGFRRRAEEWKHFHE